MMQLVISILVGLSMVLLTFIQLIFRLITLPIKLIKNLVRKGG